MLRFVPDGWLEGLLRPFLLADPNAGIYFEIAAPDLRFALLVVLLAVALSTRAARAALGAEPARALVAMALMFYIWTFATGNGRYFSVGLLLAGPLLVLACRLLPGTQALRNLVLGGVAALQLFVLQQSYLPGFWGLTRWYDAPGIGIAETPLRTQPAVFLTVTGISYSILVPRFHPQSRWANITGQREITPDAPEGPRLAALLASPLPKYVVLPLKSLDLPPSLQPEGDVLELLRNALGPQGLALTGADCVAVESALVGRARAQEDQGRGRPGLWFCPVERRAGAGAGGVDSAPRRDFDDVFARVEQRCPRFFPPGGGNEKHYDGLAVRHYVGSDTRLYIDGNDRVSYKYWRALNPTHIGSVEDVRQGRFSILCDKLPGRYQLPWQAD